MFGLTIADKVVGSEEIVEIMDNVPSERKVGLSDLPIPQVRNSVCCAVDHADFLRPNFSWVVSDHIPFCTRNLPCERSVLFIGH